MATIVRKKQEHRTSVNAITSQIAPVFRNKAVLWRVMAPYLLPKKVAKEEETEQFSFYLKKKPEVLIRDLSSFMSDSVDLPSLLHETSDVLKNVTKASWVTLYLVDRVTDEIYQSRLSERKERHKVKWSIEENSTVAAFVALKKEYVLIEDVLRDARFPEGIGYSDLISTIPKSVLCIPVMAPDNDCVGVIELVRDIHQPSFEIDDLRICVMITAWMGVAIHQNKERLALKRQQELNDYLLELVRCYFEDNVLIEKLIAEVVKFAKITLGAERGSFFIIDKDNDEMVAHLFDEDCETDVSVNSIKKVRFSKDRGIAGLVARTGVTVNIRDAYNDPRFNKEIDQRTGFITRSILCMPILGAEGVLGVVQVINKKNGGCFTNNDESLFKTFSLYCSLAVHYTNVHVEVNKRNNLNKLNLKMVKLQQIPCIHDLNHFTAQPRVNIPVDFDSFSWYINNQDELWIMPQYILHLMLQVINVSEVDITSMMKFILTVRKFYRDVPYHNFEHAFNVCHCMYAILKRNREKFSKIEIKALLIACLCHDLDHGGFTNSFLQTVKDDLAALYESSILENHHWQITQMLLQEYDHIFCDLDEQSKKLFHEEIRLAIIATDLALYFETKANLMALHKKGTFDWKDQSHRRSLKAIMMNSCDLSGSCKPFFAARRISDMLYREFYHQGDMEKNFGLCPISLMDRNQELEIPGDQIRFLNVIVIPCVEILCLILPNTKNLSSGALLLRTIWTEIIETRGQKIWRQDDSIVSSYL